MSNEPRARYHSQHQQYTMYYEQNGFSTQPSIYNYSPQSQQQSQAYAGQQRAPKQLAPIQPDPRSAPNQNPLSQQQSYVYQHPASQQQPQITYPTQQQQHPPPVGYHQPQPSPTSPSVPPPQSRGFALQSSPSTPAMPRPSSAAGPFRPSPTASSGFQPVNSPSSFNGSTGYPTPPRTSFGHSFQPPPISAYEQFRSDGLSHSQHQNAQFVTRFGSQPSPSPNPPPQPNPSPSQPWPARPGLPERHSTESYSQPSYQNPPTSSFPQTTPARSAPVPTSSFPQATGAWSSTQPVPQSSFGRPNQARPGASSVAALREKYNSAPSEAANSGSQWTGLTSKPSIRRPLPTPGASGRSRPESMPPPARTPFQPTQTSTAAAPQSFASPRPLTSIQPSPPQSTTATTTATLSSVSSYTTHTSSTLPMSNSYAGSSVGSSHSGSPGKSQSVDFGGGASSFAGNSATSSTTPLWKRGIRHEQPQSPSPPAATSRPSSTTSSGIRRPLPTSPTNPPDIRHLPTHSHTPPQSASSPISPSTYRTPSPFASSFPLTGSSPPSSFTNDPRTPSPQYGILDLPKRPRSVIDYGHGPGALAPYGRRQIEQEQKQREQLQQQQARSQSEIVGAANSPVKPFAPQIQHKQQPHSSEAQSLAYRIAAMNVNVNGQPPAYPHKSGSPVKSQVVPNHPTNNLSHRQPPNAGKLNLDDAPPVSLRRTPSPGPPQRNNSYSNSNVPSHIRAVSPMIAPKPAAPRISFPASPSSSSDEDSDDGNAGPKISVSGPPASPSVAPSRAPAVVVNAPPRITFGTPGVHISGPPAIAISSPAHGSGSGPPSISVSGLPRVSISGAPDEEDSGPSIHINGPSDHDTSGNSNGAHNKPSHLRKRKPIPELPPPNSLGGLACAGCGGGIVGRIVSAMNVRWHPDCFRCSVCDELLEHVSSYEHEGRPYCHLDYHENFAPKCYHCKTAIVDERFITLDDPALGRRAYHEEHFFCAECGDPFLAPTATSHLNRQGGGMQLAFNGDGSFEDGSVAFTVYRGHPYCENCHVRLRLPKCKGCGQAIRDHMEAVEALKGKWHWECFVCGRCQKPFEDPSFFERGDRPYCENCFSIIIKNEF